MPPPSVSLSDQSETHLRTIIFNTISLLLAVAVIALLFPFRDRIMPVISHPAFWLGTLAVCGFFIAPVPLAANLLLVAISLPVFPGRRSE